MCSIVQQICGSLERTADLNLPISEARNTVASVRTYVGVCNCEILYYLSLHVACTLAVLPNLIGLWEPGGNCVMAFFKVILIPCKSRSHLQSVSGPQSYTQVLAHEG